MPKSTRDLTTVYTGLSLEDFARFSALAAAKGLSRSELAREAIKFYLAWQQQALFPEVPSPLTQLMQRMTGNAAVPEVHRELEPLIESLYSDDDLEQSQVFEQNQEYAEDEVSGELDRKTQSEDMMEKLLGKIEQSFSDLSQKISLEQKMGEGGQERLEQRLVAMERAMVGMLSRVSAEAPASKNLEANIESRLQDLEKRISNLVARSAADVSLNGSRLENVQDQLAEIEKLFAFRFDKSLEQTLVAIDGLRSGLAEKLEGITPVDDRSGTQLSGELTAMKTEIEEHLQATKQHMESNLDQKLENQQAVIGALLNEISSKLKPSERELLGGIREQLNAVEGRLFAAMARFQQGAAGAPLSANSTSGEVKRTHGDELLRKIAVEISLLHYVLWRNQEGERDQIFNLAQAKAVERVRKWLGEVSQENNVGARPWDHPEH